MEKYDTNEHKEIEFAEQERDMQVSKEDEQLTFEKRQAEADDRERDISNGFVPLQ